MNGHSLDTRVRMCLTKQAYLTSADAVRAALHYRRKRKPNAERLRVYLCPIAEPDAPHWHLTSQPPRPGQATD